MTRIRLRYVDYFIDRNRHARYYLRRRPGPRIPLPGLPGSAEFMQAYQAALEGIATEAEPRLKRARGSPGSFDNLVQLYFESSDYARLAASTRNAYKLVIDRLIRDEGIGHRLVRQMTREHVSRIIAKRANTPGAANDVLKKIRILVRFAIDNHWRQDDPTLRIRTFPEGEFHTWTDEEIATFEAHWPVGTRERTAFALLIYTGQRLGDVRRMSWRDIEGPGIQVAQGKTGTKLWIPLHPGLTAALEQWPRSHVAILTNNFGKPFTVKGFGNWMADRIERAGLPSRCVTHGLRKAAARRLADAGCTTHQIMAITGHKSMKEVERYTKAAEQKRLAQAAINQLEVRRANKDSQP
jgi:enterobacteria phage integrase